MIDVFNGQGTVDWPSVQAAGHGAAICKATEGTGEIDPRLAQNLAGMKAAGMIRGAYHFYHVDQNPAQQAQHFINALRDAGYDFATDLPPALDLEDPAASNYTQEIVTLRVAAFLTVVEAATGRRSIIYASKWWADTFLGDAFAGHPLWLAQYTGADAPTLPTGWTEWAIWQYSETGSVAGIGGAVDLDRFRGTEEELRRWAATGVLRIA